MHRVARAGDLDRCEAEQQELAAALACLARRHGAVQRRTRVLESSLPLGAPQGARQRPASNNNGNAQRVLPVHVCPSTDQRLCDAAATAPRLYAARSRRKNRLPAAATAATTTSRGAAPAHGHGSKGVFECIILEPENPWHDPSFLVDLPGARRIGAEVRELSNSRVLADAGDADDAGADALEALLRLTRAQQKTFAATQRRVVAWVKKWLAGVLGGCGRGIELRRLVSFGSLELGLATSESDVDLMALVDPASAAANPPYLLVRLAASALQAEPPPWLVPGSVREVLQSNRCPTLTFDVRLPHAAGELNS